MRKLILTFLLAALLPTVSFAQNKVYRQGTAATIIVGPFIDDTDFVSLEEGLTVTGITIEIIQPTVGTTIPADTVTNGGFDADSDWTKNDWTIGSGTANATTVSTDLEQDISAVEDVCYDVTYTTTRSAGDVTPKVGGTAGTAVSTADTFTENIQAGSSGLIEFTGNGFTGTLDDVSVTQAPCTFTATASGGTNDMVHAEDGNYYLELDANQTGIVGQHRLSATVSGALVVWEDFEVKEQAAYDVDHGSGAVGALPADDDGTNLVEAGGTGDQFTALNDPSVAEIGVEVAAQLAAAPVLEYANAVTGTLASNQFTTDLTSTIDNFYSDKLLCFIENTLDGQCAPVYSYDQATKTITVDEAFSQAPVNGDAFEIRQDHIHTITQLATTTADQVWNELRSGHSTQGSYGESHYIIVSGTVDNDVAPTTTAFEADDITEATADHYIGRVIIFTSGALLNQATVITDYSKNGSNGAFTVNALTEAPSNDDTFIIL